MTATLFETFVHRDHRDWAVSRKGPHDVWVAGHMPRVNDARFPLTNFNFDWARVAIHRQLDEWFKDQHGAIWTSLAPGADLFAVAWLLQRSLSFPDRNYQMNALVPYDYGEYTRDILEQYQDTAIYHYLRLLYQLVDQSPAIVIAEPVLSSGQPPTKANMARLEAETGINKYSAINQFIASQLTAGDMLIAHFTGSTGKSGGTEEAVKLATENQLQTTYITAGLSMERLV